MYALEPIENIRGKKEESGTLLLKLQLLWRYRGEQQERKLPASGPRCLIDRGTTAAYKFQIDKMLQGLG